jgi:sulfite reductase beta subunit-like hemoprotein
VEALFSAHGVALAAPSSLRSRALACVSLPYCGLAIAEGERVFPAFLDEIESLLERHGLASRAPVFRLTGCANGCARPYSAEVALVGQAPGRYALYLGGDPESTRLAFLVAERVPAAQVGALLDILFGAWKAQGKVDESFGSFTHRVGLEGVRGLLAPAG